ncbi:uncharacterized protein LOC129944139 [Eupeodes corollae]|uniref:uncharacterized protein LOC129944139 n=1 Tax=Eupeodes corollae TaxID=290404 RepID=UPI002491C627|nr:uncharacterized protein LOC129944139 [Eupeodes corollae]
MDNTVLMWLSRVKERLNIIPKFLAVNTRKTCREVIVDHFLENQEIDAKIGGSGRIVQIDESKFGRQKFNKGRRVDGHLVLGMIEYEFEDLRLELCTGNVLSADVLIPLIRNCLGEHGYIHKKLNHGEPDNPFVAEDGTHTQRIESQWRILKRAFYNDSYNHNFADWVVEYQWRRIYNDITTNPKSIYETYSASFGRLSDFESSNQRLELERAARWQWRDGGVESSRTNPTL